MNLVLSFNLFNRPVIVTLSGLKLLLAISLLLTVLLLASASVGYFISQHYNNPTRLVKIWKNELQKNQEKIKRVIWESEIKIDSLARKLGNLHYELSLIDSILLKLAKYGSVDLAAYKKEKNALGKKNLYTQKKMGKDKYYLVDLSSAYQSLEDEIESKGQELNYLYSLYSEKHLDQTTIPKGWPVARKGGYISSFYGFRIHPRRKEYRFHYGVDFASTLSYPDVYALAAGTVITAEFRGNWGNIVEIDHGDYITRYAHNEKIYVPVGSAVYRGQPIALLGSTGNSTGPHVHLEIMKNGKHVDPLRFIGESVATSSF